MSFKNQSKIIDLSTGGLDGHAVVRHLLQQTIPKIDPAACLGYCNQASEENLKRVIAKLWKIPKGEIILTSSGTEALYLALQALSSPVAVQSPAYFGVWRIQRMLRQRAIPWENISAISPVRPVYVCPNCNPGNGLSLTQEERNHLIKHPDILIEDDPYFPLATKPVARIVGLRKQPFDMITGSFSKLLLFKNSFSNFLRFPISDGNDIN